MTVTRNARRQLQGVVVSNRAAQTITVRVERTYKHPKYGKYVRQRKKYMAHDVKEGAAVGDLVEIEATRPLSKLKRWRLVRIVHKSDMAEPTLDEQGGNQ